MAAHRYVEGCPCCDAQREGREGILDPATPEGWVYATRDKPYARYYASRAVGGDLYLVKLLGDLERSDEDHFPTWRGRRAIVLRVVERGITLTHVERRKLHMRWGGSEEEIQDMRRRAKVGAWGGPIVAGVRP